METSTEVSSDSQTFLLRKKTPVISFVFPRVLEKTSTVLRFAQDTKVTIENSERSQYEL